MSENQEPKNNNKMYEDHHGILPAYDDQAKLEFLQDFPPRNQLYGHLALDGYHSALWDFKGELLRMKKKCNTKEQFGEAIDEIIQRMDLLSSELKEQWDDDNGGYLKWNVPLEL